MKMLLRNLFLPAFIFLLSACEKVVDLKVGDSTPQMVIEGTLTESGNPVVRITKSTSYTQPNVFPVVQDALVILRDRTAGLTDTLLLSGSGNAEAYYSRRGVPGIPGHTYELEVFAEGKTYTAVSTMPQPVTIDSVYTITQSLFGAKAAQVYLVFTDPPNVPNYYRCIVYINGRRERFDVRDDRLTDGRENGRPVIIPYTDSTEAGDTATIELQGLDEGTHRYFATFFDADGNSAAPANPISNISGGARGYFGAITSQRVSIVLE